jgi:hypothetical protein
MQEIEIPADLLAAMRSLIFETRRLGGVYNGPAAELFNLMLQYRLLTDSEIQSEQALRSAK